MLPSGAQPMQSGDTVNPVFPSLRRESGMLCVIVISLYLLFLTSPGKNNILYTKFRIHYCTYKSQEQIEDGALEMTKLPVEPDEAGENSNTQDIGESVSPDGFNFPVGRDHYATLDW